MRTITVERAPNDGLLPDFAAHSETADAAFPQDPHWMAALRHALMPGQLDLFVLREGTVAVGLLPLTPTSLKTGGMRVRMMGTPMDRSVDLTDALLLPSHRRADVLSAALSDLTREYPWDLIRFRRVRQRSHLLDALHGLEYRYSLVDAGASASCDVSSTDALTALSREQLRNVARLRRRAERDYGPVTTETIADSTVADASFDRFVALESVGWKGADPAGTSLALDAQAQAFFRDVMKRLQPFGRARIDFLSIGGRDAAAQLAVRAGHSWFILKIGYHPDFRDVGPGSLLLKAFVEEMCRASDVREVSLTTNPPWAARWHFRTEPTYDVLIYGRTWRGRALAAGRIGKEFLKSIRHRLPTRSDTATK